MTAEKSSKTDKVAAAVEEIEKAAAGGSTKKKAPAKKAAKPKTPKAKTAKEKADEPGPAAAKKTADAAEKKPAAKTPTDAVEKKAVAPKKKPAKKAKKQQLRITQVKSQIGFDSRQKKVLAGLGLGRIGKKVVRVDDPCIRGMVAKVSHLVSVEEVEA